MDPAILTIVSTCQTAYGFIVRSNGVGRLGSRYSLDSLCLFPDMRASFRRIFASLTLLSVLFGSLGGTHPACAMLGTALLGREARVSAGDEQTVPAATTHQHARHDAARTPQHGEQAGGESDHHGSAPSECRTVTHCVAVALAPASNAVTRYAPVAETPQVLTSTMLVGPAVEPASPPPRA